MTDTVPLLADINEHGLTLMDASKMDVIAEIPSKNVLSNVRLENATRGLLLTVSIAVSSCRFEGNIPNIYVEAGGQA